MAPNAPLSIQQNLASKIRVAWQSNSRWDSIISVFVLVTVLILLVISARYRSRIDPLRVSLGCIALGVLFLLPITLRLISRLYITHQSLSKQNKVLQGLTHNYQHAVVPHNKLNTLLVSAMISFALPALHLAMWAPGLAVQKIETAVDETSSPVFPALALLEDPNWSSQAHLSLKKDPKCFLGRWRDDLPLCGQSTPGMACNCANDWALPMSHLEWKNITYKLLQFQPKEYEMSTEPGQPLMAQAFFSYNAQRAMKDRGSLLQPSVLLAIWDPHLRLTEALERGLTRMVLINANALTSINLHMQLRQTHAGSSYAYDYGESDISSIPSISLMCDTSNTLAPYKDLCEVNLQLQYLTFERSVRSIRSMMEWTDVVAAAGSWISLFQIVAWILSGLAIH